MGLFSFGKKKVEESINRVEPKEYYPTSTDRTLEGIELDGNPYDITNTYSRDIRSVIGENFCKFIDTHLTFCTSYLAKTFRNVLVISDKMTTIDNNFAEINKKIDIILAQNNELKQRNHHLETEIEALKRR